MPIFSTFLRCGLDFKHFEKKMPLIAYVFLKLWTAKVVVRQISKKSRFRQLFDRQHGKRSHTLLRSPKQQLYHIYWLLWGKLGWRKSLLLIFKTLGQFLNTLTGHDKYSLFKSDNLRQPIEMQLSKKQNFLSICFCIFEI